MKRSSFLPFVFGLTIALSAMANAQFIEDALRIAEPPDAVNARSAGMGNAFIGVADDFSALYWNPAGLGQLKRSEFSLALTNLKVSNTSNFLGVPGTGDNSSTYLNSLGLALPFPVTQGSFVIAAGYNRLVNYTSALNAKAFNSNSSIQPALYNDSSDYDLAWQIGLENDRSLTIPIYRNVTQSQNVLESGNLGQWSFGLSSEVAPRLLIGASLNVVTGSYRYQRMFVESAAANTDTIIGVGGITRIGFLSTKIDHLLTQDISGWSAKLGFLYTFNESVRAGMTIQTPTSVTVHERLTAKGQSQFTNSTVSGAINSIEQEYDISTSWVFGFGASVKPLSFLTISADADLTDYSTLSFDNAEGDLMDRNFDFSKYLKQIVCFRIGAECKIPGTGLAVRGGYGVSPTPFLSERADDITQIINFGMGYRSRNYDLKTLSMGLGYELNELLTFNVAYSMRSFKTFTLNYIDPDINVPFRDFRTDEDVTNNSILVSISYGI